MILDVGDRIASGNETLLRGVILLALEGVDLDLKLELATLQLIDSLGSGFASNTDTRR